MRRIIAYTDGSAVVVGPRKGQGGFGVYFPNFYGKPKALALGFSNTKTGRMEVSALLYAINAFYMNHEEEIELTVYSDSEYVVKSFTEGRLKKWIKNDWQSYGNLVKNIDLWKKVVLSLEYRPFLKLKMIHIKSHQVEKEKDPKKKALLKKDKHIIGNQMADFLADYKRHKILKPDIK